jgi:hypothetical protein
VKRRAIEVLVLVAAVAILCLAAYLEGLRQGRAEGYVVGLRDGVRLGIVSCPCWER